MIKPFHAVNFLTAETIRENRLSFLCFSVIKSTSKCTSLGQNLVINDI